MSGQSTGRAPRIAVIGCGRHAGRVHYPSVRDLGDRAVLVAIADLDEGRLTEIGAKYGVALESRYTDYRKMLEREDLDAVYVIMEPRPGTPIVLDVLAAKKHVFMEKPPGMNLEQCGDLANSATKNGVFLQIGWNRRFAPVVRKAAEAIRAIGTQTLVVGEFHKDLPRPDPYYGTGSWLLSDQSHTLDTIMYLGGGIATSMEANTRNIHGFVDCSTALFSFPSGAAGVFLSNYACGARIERFEIHCKDASAYMEPPERAYLYEKRAVTGFYDPNAKRERVDFDGVELVGGSEFHRTYGYFQETEHFVECVRTGTVPETDITYAHELVRIIDKIERAGIL